jgi:hypothetical protein
MAGPWEDFGGTVATAAPAGPWQDFAAPAPEEKRKPWEEFAAPVEPPPALNLAVPQARPSSYQVRRQRRPIGRQ